MDGGANCLRWPVPKDDSWILGGDPFDVSNYVVLGEKPAAEASPEAILTAGVIKSALDGETALFDVLPGIGKSRSILTLATETEVPISVFTNLRDNYGQFKRWGAKVGVPVVKLPTRTLCPTLREDDSRYSANQIAQVARAARDAGWSPSIIHREFDLPCNSGGKSCPYKERVNGIKTDEPRFLVGHFTQAYNSAYVDDRVVILDERCFDSYTQQIQNPIDKVNEFIPRLKGFPFNQARRPQPGEQEKQSKALQRLEEVGLDPDDHSGDVGEFDARAPLVAYAIYGADRMTNGLHFAETPSGRTLVFENLHQNSVWLLDPPAFSNAEAVLALDATPCISNWERIVGSNLQQYRLFNDRQRNRYLRDVGYEFRLLNTHVWPVSGGDISLAKSEAYLREIRLKHGQRPDLISSKRLIASLEEEGLSDLWGDDLHYNALRGKNTLQDSELLVVLGSPGRSDRYYQYQAALHGECAEAATDDNDTRLGGHELDYQSDVANDVLESTRRGEVFQAAMRAGRTPGTKAMIYIATGMVPEWLSTQLLGRRTPWRTFDVCESPRGDAERAVLETLKNKDGISGREVARQSDLPQSTAQNAINSLHQEGVVEKSGAGPSTSWHSCGLAGVNPAGRVDLSTPDQGALLTNTPLEDSHKGNLVNRPLLVRRGQGVEPFGYPQWIEEIRLRARKRRLAELFDRAY